MEDDITKIGSGNMKREDLNQSASVVDSVMHEYDVIDEAHHQNDNIYDRASESTVPNTVKPVTRESGNQQMSSRHRLSSSDRSQTGPDNHIHTPHPPRVNCKEKIIFCVDISSDMEKPSFRSRAGDRMSAKHLAKRGLSIFLQSKQRLDRKHEVALIFLQETAIWARDFSNNPRDILIALEDVVESHPCDTCDLSSVFDRIVENVDIPQAEGDVEVIPPAYTVRLVLVYGRSNCPPQFSKKESFQMLNASPYFFLDVLYIHEPLSEENRCQEVFDSICELDGKGLSYIINACKNPTKVYDGMSQLLAHPLQRPPQNEAVYRIGSSIPQPENG